jgi:adenylate kinase
MSKKKYGLRCFLFLVGMAIVFRTSAQNEELVKMDLNQLNNKTVMSFLGAPGSGKGTLADLCQKELGFESISTGDLFRKEIASGSKLGEKLKAIINTGRLVPDELTVEILKVALSEKMKLGKPIILDGFPRTAGQAEVFVNLLNSGEFDLSLKVVAIKLSDEAIISRLAGRLVCSSKECQSVYSTLKGVSTNPKKSGFCDKCGSPLIIRNDDNEETVRERLRVYAKNEDELVNYYKEANVSVVDVDIEGLSPQEAFEKLKQKLGDHLAIEIASI